MSNHRRRTLIYAGGGLLGVWLLAGAGYMVSKWMQVTSAKVAAYLHETDLGKLSGEARARALRDLAAKMNALAPEERRKARQAGDWERWFAAMTEEEKGALIEATMPQGFKQMLASFEKLPEEKRTRAVEDSLREMRKVRDEVGSTERDGDPLRRGTNGPPLSEELQQKMVKIGLKSFYSDSSAQTKAELAPVLEEMQRQMERGSLFRNQRPQ